MSVAEFETLPEGLPVGDGRVLLLNRFDRAGDAKIHVEDLAQVLDVPPGSRQYSRSYCELGRVLRVLCSEDIEEYVRRVAFMMVSGNGDAHLKNWGVIYADGRTPRLSPAYDLISTVCRIPNDGLALDLAGTKRWSDLDRDRVTAFLVECHDDFEEAAGWFYDTLGRAIDLLRSQGESFGFSESDLRTLHRHIDAVTRGL